MQCKFCLSQFKSQESLQYHQQSARYCFYYKDVIFTCGRCGFYTRGIRNIEKHLGNCKIQGSKDPISNLKGEMQTLQSKLVTLEDANNNLQKKIIELKGRLQIESLRTNILSNIVEENSPVQVSNLWKERIDAIHIYTPQVSSKIPIILHKYIKDHPVFELQDTKTITKHSLLPKNLETSKRPTYRTLPSLSLSNETVKTELVKRVKKIDKLRKDELGKWGDLRATQSYFIQELDNLKRGRIYTEILQKLCNRRSQVLGCLPLSEYCQLLHEQICQIEKIFKGKQFTSKKIKQVILKGLSPLESRLIRYPGWDNTYLEVDEIEGLERSLKLWAHFPKEFTIHNDNILCGRILFRNHNSIYRNYSLALFPLRRIIEIFLLNPYNLHNVIYISLPNASKHDPFSFYTLARIVKGRRQWRQDCRLHHLCTALIDDIRPYLIEMFRDSYSDLFGDNDFRPSFLRNSTYERRDHAQLLKNIILLSQPKKFCNEMRELIKNKATYCPTSMDGFNLKSDDRQQRDEFKSKKEKIDVVDIIKQCFDSSQTEEMVDLYRELS